MKMHRAFPFILLLILSACKQKEGGITTENSSILEKIAQAHGLNNFDELTELNYTFNVKVQDSLRTSRTWRWHPKTNRVTLLKEDTTLTYNQKKEATRFPELDQQFINDQYWLLFPFHLVWDELEYEHNLQAKAPISGEQMQQLIVRYPSDKGYTPGDVYEIYFGDDYILKEWVYKRGGNNDQPFAATWEGYNDFAGIQIATNHRSEDGDFKVFFSNISFK